jgi:Family of unknown function (DUF6361)
MESFIGWLDHSEEDQRRVREMLQLFSDKGTVDDLGIGTVRDAISNALFPGTSIIQTRARYFLFVPWIFRRAERRHPHQLVAKASDMERTLIGALREGGDHAGLIGVDAGRNVRTLPSTIFWGGLIRYGIFLAPSLTIRQYGRYVARGLVAADAEDEIGDRAPSFWQREIPDPPAGYFSFTRANFDLTRDEAEWPSEQVISSDRMARHESLLTVFIKDLSRGGSPSNADTVWDAALPTDTTEAITHLVHHAERFSCAAHGAALLYNLQLAEARRQAGREETDATSVQTYRTRLDQWRADAHRVGIAPWAARIDDFWDCLLDHGARIPPPTRRFIDKWARLLATDARDIASSVAARDLVHYRELEHKRGQARLANRKRLDEWAGNAGTVVLTFRWSQVKTMLTDIHNGLHAVESDGNAVA